MKFKLLVMSVTALLLEIVSIGNCVAQLAHQNLLANGGFNAQGFPYPGDFNLILAPWGWSGSIAYSWANDGATIGPGVTLDAGGVVGFGDGSIYQDVATVPGQLYQLTITAHSRGTTEGTWLQPFWNGGALPLGFAQYFEWTAITYNIQATTSSSRVTITPDPNNGGPTWIDSVSLIAIPEPSVSTFITAASAGLLAFSRRARRIKLPYGTGN
jgi:hypothetical protein